MSQVKGCADTGNGKHGQFHMLHPGWLVFSPLDFPALGARWVPTASVARCCMAAGQNLPPAPAACFVQDAKNKPGARNRVGKAFSVLGCSVTRFSSFTFFKRSCKCNAGLVRAPGMVYTRPGHQARFATVTHLPLALLRPQQLPMAGLPGCDQPCWTSWDHPSRVPEGSGCGWMRCLSQQRLPAVTSPTLLTEQPRAAPSNACNMRKTALRWSKAAHSASSELWDDGPRGTGRSWLLSELPSPRLYPSCGSTNSGIRSQHSSRLQTWPPWGWRSCSVT